MLSKQQDLIHLISLLKEQTLRGKLRWIKQSNIKSFFDICTEKIAIFEGYNFSLEQIHSNKAILLKIKLISDNSYHFILSSSVFSDIWTLWHAGSGKSIPMNKLELDIDTLLHTLSK